MKKNIFVDSIKLLYVQGIIIILMSNLNKHVSGNWLFIINSILFLSIFMIYSRIRYNEYRILFLKKGNRFILIDNISLLFGIVYLSCMDQFVFKQENTINIPFVFSLLIFIFPSLIRNVKMQQIRNNENKSN